MLGPRAQVIFVILGASGAGLGATALGAGCTSFSADEAPVAGDASSSATSDADAGPLTDAGPPCSDRTTVTFGPSSLSLAERAPDFIAAQIRDAHFFVARSDGSARCAWLYIVTPPTSGAVHFGVYADKGGAPDALVRRVKFDHPIAGWNSAPLDAPLPIARDTPMWIAVGPDSASISVSSIEDAGCPTPTFTGMLAPGVELTDPFSGTKRYPSCNLDAYLGP